jgi:hypothetical protein
VVFITTESRDRIDRIVTTKVGDKVDDKMLKQDKVLTYTPTTITHLEFELTDTRLIASQMKALGL